MASLEGGGGVGGHFSPSGSNAKNKNKSPMLIPILFHEVMGDYSVFVFLRTGHFLSCHGFYFIHCVQFSQLNDLDIVRSCAQLQVRS